MHTIGGLKVFEQVFVITAGGPGFASQVLGTYIFTAFAQEHFGRSSAVGGPPGLPAHPERGPGRAGTVPSCAPKHLLQDIQILEEKIK